MALIASRIQIARAYNLGKKEGEYRVLVDRLWPRGVSKIKLQLDRWCKEIAPSTELREWFRHDPRRWTDFNRRYRDELHQQRELLEELRGVTIEHPLLLIYGAKDELHNNAIVLREVLLQRAMNC
ncbi:DUF488 domain-containing protein [Planctomicrobium sp. SH664]|uniref:DUF488 domain-containing protein n=1 Tax=Planctomicrobium sp. SH664 TaxID=3448125 RepID=UPI003F5C9FE6